MKINISFTNATELCQISHSDDAKNIHGEKISVIRPMKQRVFTTNSAGNVVSFFNPYYSGNGFRGMLRRECFRLILESAVKRGIPMPKSTDFHFMDCGGGNNYSTQSLSVEDDVRELNPLVSVFGTSLAISGKLKTSNLVPYKNFSEKEYYTTPDPHNEGGVKSSILYLSKFNKDDNLLSRKGNAVFIEDDVIDAWIEYAKDNREEVAKTRDSEDKAEKVKKGTIKSRIGREFVVRNVDFYGSIGVMDGKVMTSIEKGMIYRALEGIVLRNLGSNSARNFGMVEYYILLGEDGILETSVDGFGNSKISNLQYGKEEQKDVDAFDKWLENFKKETFSVSEIMTASK